MFEEALTLEEVLTNCTRWSVLCVLISFDCGSFSATILHERIIYILEIAPKKCNNTSIGYYWSEMTSKRKELKLRKCIIFSFLIFLFVSSFLLLVSINLGRELFWFKLIILNILVIIFIKNLLIFLHVWWFSLDLWINGSCLYDQ